MSLLRPVSGSCHRGPSTNPSSAGHTWERTGGQGSVIPHATRKQASPGLTNEHEQSSSHGGTVGKTKLPHDLVGHGD